MSTTNFFGPIISPACNCYNITANGITVPESAAGWGCVLQTFQNLMNVAIALGTVLITLYIAWAGVAYLMAPINAEGRQAGKTRLMNAVLGLLIMLGAWLLIDSIMKVIYAGNSNTNPAGFLPWNSILTDNNAADDCIAPRSPPVAAAGAPAVSNAAGGTPPAAQQAGASPTGSCGATSGLNCTAAISYLESHANPLNDYTGQCAQYVRQAIAAGGLSSFNSGQGNAYQYGPILTAANFTAVYTGTYSSSSGTAFAYQEGDVVVFQPVSGHPYGHITMYTGSQWISDAIQSNMASNQADYQGGSFTVYRP